MILAIKIIVYIVLFFILLFLTFVIIANLWRDDEYNQNNKDISDRNNNRNNK